MSDTNDQEAVRERLLAMRAALEATAEGRREAGATVELDQTRTGRLSRMDALQLQAMARENQARARLQLRRIEAALRRLDEGEYGCCVTCGEEISPGRLGADPAVPTCLDCASRAERRG